MEFAFGQEQARLDNAIQVDPRSFLANGDNAYAFGGARTDYPYQVWGYLGLNNYLVSRRIKALYETARTRLAAYYGSMGLDAADSAKAARSALYQRVYGADCSDGLPETSLRRMLLERAPAKAIAAHLASGQTVPQTLKDCSRYAGIDPLLLVAVADPPAFPLVLGQASNVDIRNPIGKTALMEASQFDKTALVRQLLARHATVNATTWANGDQVMDPLGDDARTALMYAAANGSLDLIRTLLDAGADPYQADTKGYRAIDYLLGYGPTPPNRVLDKRERQMAARWLF